MLTSIKVKKHSKIKTMAFDRFSCLLFGPRPGRYVMWLKYTHAHKTFSVLTFDPRHEEMICVCILNIHVVCNREIDINGKKEWSSNLYSWLIWSLCSFRSTKVTFWKLLNVLGTLALIEQKYDFFFIRNVESQYCMEGELTKMSDCLM